METAYIKTPLGTTKIIGDENGISVISVADNGAISAKIPTVLQEAISQLNEYFEGNRRNFIFKLNPAGTEFQQKVWKELLEIPFGKTMSYLELSKKLVLWLRPMEKTRFGLWFPVIELLAPTVRSRVMLEDCGAKNGCWNTKIPRSNKSCLGTYKLRVYLKCKKTINIYYSENQFK
jgi:hypothetical protein